MAVTAIQKKDTHRANYIKAAATGALTGYALKYILPLNQAEKDEKFMSDHFIYSANKAKQEALQSMMEAQEQTTAEKEFIKMTVFEGISPDKIKRHPEPVSTQIKQILAKVNDAGREAKAFSKKAYIAITKSIRPSRTFIALGAGTAVIGAFIYNVIQKMSEE